MKFALFNDHRPGRVEDDAIVDLSDALGAAVMNLAPEDRVPALIGGDAEIQAILAMGPGVRRRLDSVRLRAPLVRPSKMLFALGNYPEGAPAPKGRLNLGLKAPTSILDPGGVVVLPSRDARVFQPEPELAVVIGRPARRVSEQDALSHIFGYSCVLDMTARGLGYGMGVDSNSFDTFCPIGPWIVTADEVGDPQSLQVRYWHDGDLRSEYSTADMEHSVAALVSWASHVGRLEVGDVISCGVSHQQLGAMQDGETAMLEISGIGRLTASISDPLRRQWPKGVDLGLAQAATQARLDGTPLNIKAAAMTRLS